jgi:hypothetical protein
MGRNHARTHARKGPLALKMGSVSAALLGVCALASVSCKSQPKQKPCVDKSAPALKTCNEKADKLQQQLNSLKVKLAQALQNPGTIKVDPTLLELVGPDGKKKKIVLQEGSLKPAQVTKVMRLGKAALQSCYTRALKRNTALHHTRLKLQMAFKVRPSGSPTSISLKPNRDAKMIDCMVKAIRRWKFPAFTGQPVDVKTTVPLVPKG